MYLCTLFWGLVLTQPFSLDCHHTFFFFKSLTKVRKNKSIRWSWLTCNNFKQFHLSSHPLQFLEIYKRGNSQLVVYNSSTEEFRKEYMNKLHAADVETSFFPFCFMLQTWSMMIRHPIPSPKKSSPWKLMPPSLPPNSRVGDTDIAKLCMSAAPNLISYLLMES